MPIVPRNTISEPVRTRLPQIRMAQPRTAEAMGAVTSALGRRAAAIGRNSSIIGEQIDATRRMGNEQMRILGAKAASEQAMWQGLGNLGNIMMNAGFKMDRIQERRDIEDARNAATEFTLALDPLVFGHVDPDTGERVAGALETPYSPGDAESDPNSPSIAVSKTMKELLDNPDAPWANLSPRARREFENDVARLRQGYMRQAIKADGDQIQIFRQVSQKRDYEAMMGHLTNLGAGTTPAETQNWLNEFNTSVTAYQRTYMGQYWNEDKQEWASPQIEKIVAQEREELLEVALSKRLETWLQLADVENDPERRENLLSYVETWAEMKNGEDAVLPELARAKVLKEISEVRFRAVQRDNRLTLQAAEAVKTALDNFMEAPTPENQQALQESLANPRLSRTDAEAAQVAMLDHRVNTQIGMLKHLMATDPAQAQHYMGTMDAAAIAKWNEMNNGIPDRVKTMLSSYEQDMFNITLTAGGVLNWEEDKNGNVRPVVDLNIQRTELRRMAADMWARGVIDMKQHDDYIERINALKNEPPFIALERQEAIRAMEEILGTDIVDNAITMQNGMVALAYDDGKPLDIFATGRERMPYKGQSYVRSDGTIVSQKDSKGIELDAKAVVAVLQYVTDYHRLNPVPDPKTGMPKTTRDIVRDLLMPGPNQPVEVHNSLRFKTQANAERWSRQLYDLQSRFFLQKLENLDRQYGISQ
jgi:hypothetical protein